MAGFSLDLVAADQLKMLKELRLVRERLGDLNEIKTMLRLQREMIDIGSLDRHSLKSQIARLQKRVARLEDAGERAG